MNARAMVLVATLAACDSVPEIDAPPAQQFGAAPPTCHEIATAWCDDQERCGPVDESCHGAWHARCPELQDAGAPEASRACVDALAAACLDENINACRKQER